MVAVAVVLVATQPSAVSAQFAFDPSKVVYDEYKGWIPLAQGWAKRIYGTLLIFEFVAIGLTSLLFRDNIGEMFGTLGFKAFLGGVYFWFISNAGIDGWPQKVIDTFTGFGVQLGGNTNLAWLGIQGMGAALAYFAAPVAAQIADGTLGTSAGLECTFFNGYGNCNTGLVMTAEFGHLPFQFVCNGLALIIVMAMAAIFLQFILISIESYMVMGAGILYIGFAASRFTASFSQGYFGYLINVGTKLMVLYIVLGVEQKLMPTILLTAGTTLAAAAAIPGGEAIALLPAAVGAFEVVIAAALVWTLPGFAAAFLSGQSSASGSAVLSQAVSSMAGAAQMMAQVGSASRAESRIKEARSERSEMQATMQSNGQQLGGAGADTLAPAQQGPSFGTGASGADGASGANGASGAGGASATGGALGGVGHTTGSGRTTLPLPGAGSPGRADVVAPLPAQSTARQLQSSGTEPNRNVAFSPPAQNAMPQTSSQSSLPASRDLTPISDASTDSASGSAGYSNSSVPRNLTTGQPLTGPTQSGQRSTNSSIGFGEVQPHDIRGMTSKAEANRLASSTEWKDLTPDQQRAVMNNQVTRDAMFERLNSTEQDARRDEEFAGAYALNGLAQAAPREIGQPTAVQVRISNPDKL